jgi:hypothetical protein
MGHSQIGPKKTVHQGTAIFKTPLVEQNGHQGCYLLEKCIEYKWQNTTYFNRFVAVQP